MKPGLILPLTLILASCASSAEWNGTPPPPAPAASPARAPPAPIQLPAPPPISRPPLPVSDPDTCGMNELKSLIGRPRTEIPVPVDPSRRRVVCTTCPMTRDLRPDRLTVLYDADTGRVTKLMCQ